MPPAVRSSQRAPRSCTYCSRRKIKCDKQLPCATCRARGMAETCRSESVWVKGQFVSGAGPPSQPSYADLVAETQRLRAALLRPRPPARARPLHSADPFERMLYARLRAHRRPSTVQSLACVVVPSARCSRALLQHAFQWTSWLHCAIDHAEFAAQHHHFLRRCEAGSLETAAETPWLGLYFAHLSATLWSMTDAEAAAADLPSPNIGHLLQNWFDAALFLLHAADFLRTPNYINVQTIAVLGLSCAPLGEFNLYCTLWACGARLCQAVGIGQDNECVGSEPVRLRESRRQLYWSFIISDWLSFQLGNTCINGNEVRVDFTTDLADQHSDPAFDTDTISCPRPIHYHITLAKLASALNRFTSSFGHVVSLQAAVQSADNDLANIISELPPHLCAGEASSALESAPGWVSWQQRSISVLFLYYRMVVNRTICNNEPKGSAVSAGATAICFEAAHGICRLLVEKEDHDPRHYIW
ncbi:hypothetical protein P154DRAFT_450946 [Neofusicoccum parvum]|nr:hypothetical protein P154DRAFT_450946 [Neofusicoccum parvum]